MWCNHDHHQPEEGCSAEDKEMLERRSLIQGLAAGGILTVTGTSMTGCATNAETGSKQLLLVGDSQLSQMAAASWNDTKSKIPTSNDPRYTSRLRNIGSRISRGANKDQETWDYAVFDRDTKNAFVLPGNRVGFYRGMMDFADNDDQIAAIMGHEVGHVTGKHAAERVSQQLAKNTVVAGGTALAGAHLAKKCRSQGLARIGGRSRNQIQRAEAIQIQREYQQCMGSAHRNTGMINAALGVGFTVGILLPYSRKHEKQSDLLGAIYMHKAGYDSYQAVKLWEKMAENSPSRQPEFLSTHPEPSSRARNLHNFIKVQEKLGSQGWQSIKLPKIKKA